MFSSQVSYLKHFRCFKRMTNSWGVHNDITFLRSLIVVLGLLVQTFTRMYDEWEVKKCDVGLVHLRFFSELSFSTYFTFLRAFYKL